MVTGPRDLPGRLACFRGPTKKANLSGMQFVFVHHEPFPVRSRNLVLNDLAGSVALGNAPRAACRGDLLVAPEAKRRFRVRIIKCFQSTMPMNPEWPDPVNLDDRPIGRVAEHPAALRSERVRPCPELLEQLTIEFFAEAEIPGS